MQYLTSKEPEWGARLPLPPKSPSVPSLPEAMIPERLRQWLVDIADRAAIPLEMPTIPALVGAGAIIGRLSAFDRGATTTM